MQEIYTRAGASDFAIDKEENKMWFSLMGKNGLIEYDIESEKVNVLCRFQDDVDETINLFNSIAKIGKKLILVPCKAEEIIIYDLELRGKKSIKLRTVTPNNKKAHSKNSKFYKYIVDGKYIFLLGDCYPAIVRIDVETYELIYIDGWVKVIDEYLTNEDEERYLHEGKVINGDVISIPFWCKNAFLELNRKTLECSVRQVGVEVDGITGISSDEYHCYFVGRGKNSNYLYYSDINMKNYEKIKICDEASLMGPLFRAPVCNKTKQEIYLFPIYAKHIYRVNINKRKVAICEEFEDGCLEFEKKGLGFFGTTAIKVIGEKIIFMTGRDFKWHIYDMETGETQEFSISLPENFVEEQLKRIISKKENDKNCLYEGKIPLQVFLSTIMENGEIENC